MRIPFAPPPGLVSDDTTFASPGVWEDGSNVRFWQGKPQVIGGWADAIGGLTLTGVCRNAFTWKNNNGSLLAAFGTHTRLQLFYGSALYNITPAGLVDGSIDGASDGPGWGVGDWGEGAWGDPALTYYPRTWSLSTYGDDLIANPRGGTIYRWTGDESVVAAALTNAPAVVTYALVTPERQVLAFGCNEESGGAFNALCIRGSDIENITTWATAATNNAFEHILEGGGRIVAASKIGAYVAVWTDRGLHLGQFIGAPDQTYRFDMVADHCGLIGPNAFAIVDQTAYWVGSDKQFRVWQVGGVPQILPCPIHRDFAENVVVAQSDKIFAATMAQFGEIWFHYPDSRDGIENSRYVVFCAEESRKAQRPVWFRGVMERTAGCDAGATTYPVRATVAGNVYYHESGVSAAGSSLTGYVTSADYYIDEGGRAVMLRRFEPDFEEQDASVSLTVYTRPYPRGTVKTYGPHTITTASEKVDFRASGKLVAVKMSVTSATPSMRLGRPIFDAVPLGTR